MELAEVYRQLILEIKNNIKYRKTEDMDFILKDSDDSFNLAEMAAYASKLETQTQHEDKNIIENTSQFQTPSKEIETPLVQKVKKVEKRNIQSDFPKDSQLYKINKQVMSCKKCSLYKTRNNTVFGEGNLDADIMFIGEGPGGNEDLTGRPFVGKAGELLVKIIENVMKLKREDVYMANIVKCRPPGNRNPSNLEVSACIGYLHRQINIIKPKIIVPLGTVALSTLLPQHRSIIKSRGRNMILALSKENIYDVIATYHPSYLLRGEQSEINKKKREVWEDIKKIMKKLDLPA